MYSTCICTTASPLPSTSPLKASKCGTTLTSIVIILVNITFGNIIIFNIIVVVIIIFNFDSKKDKGDTNTWGAILTKFFIIVVNVTISDIIIAVIIDVNIMGFAQSLTEN